MEEFYIEWVVLQNECEMIQIMFFKDKFFSGTDVGKLSCNQSTKT